jgi:hypothetical protein
MVPKVERVAGPAFRYARDLDARSAGIDQRKLPERPSRKTLPAGVRPNSRDQAPGTPDIAFNRTGKSLKTCKKFRKSLQTRAKA